METCVREKYNLLFPWNLVKFIFFLYPWKEKVVSVKILTISLYHVHEKKIPLWKYLKMRPWKIGNAREKVLKNVRESHITFREKNQKKAENGFHGHFLFSRKKKFPKWKASR